MSEHSLAILFAGQGAQRVGMGADLLEREALARSLYEQADAILGWPLTRVMLEGPDEDLTRTSRCQPALYLHGYTCWELLRQQLPGLAPAAAAGLSLGEFTAHAAAGTLDFASGLRLVAQRGAFMEEACGETEGSMAAILGGHEEAVRRLAEACEVDVANLNAPGQIVLSGSRAGIDQVLARAKEFSLRARALKVAGAFHSRLMQSARAKLLLELEQTGFQAPRFPVISNVTAAPATDPATIRSTLADQVTGSVRWSESIQQLASRGVTRFLELGPGGILRGMVQRIAPSVHCRSIEDSASLDQAVAWLEGSD